MAKCRVVVREHRELVVDVPPPSENEDEFDVYERLAEYVYQNSSAIELLDYEWVDPEE